VVDQLVDKAQQQGTLRPDLLPSDLPVVQLMVAAVTDHTGQPELWRRYLALLVDGMRACPARPSAVLPAPPGLQNPVQQALVDSSVRQANDRREGRPARPRRPS